MTVEYSVIVPTYNERENLPLLLWIMRRELREVEGGYEVVVVDDNSPDGTARVCQDFQRKVPDMNIKLVEREGKLGLGTAYRSGLKVATGNFVILMDADLSHHPKFIVDFIRLQKETQVDIVSGTRYQAGGGVCGWSATRMLMSRGANFIAQLVLSLPETSDLTGSFRLYKRSLFQQVIAKTESKGYVFQIELLARAIISHSASIEQVPIIFVDRIFGISKLGANEIVGFLKGILLLFWTL